MFPRHVITRWRDNSSEKGVSFFGESCPSKHVVKGLFGFPGGVVLPFVLKW